jgi:site-specific DNA recombinase
MNTYNVYCRKSSEPDERQALSNESQKAENYKTAKRYGITDKQIIEPVIEEAHSAKIAFSREKFNLMVKSIAEGKANGIICWQPDRLSRNNGDMTVLINLLESGQLEEIITSNQVFRNNPLDKFMFGFLCLQAKLENDKKGVDVKRGLKTKAEKGWLPSGAKPGYMNDKYAEKGNKTVLKDPTRFSLIRKAWDLMLTGAYTPPQILRILNEEWGYTTPKHKRIGGKPMCRSMIYKVLTDEFYYGKFEYPVGSGTWHIGKQDKMITPEEFARVQQLLGRKSRPRPKTRNFAYTGLFNCNECGAAITAEEKFQIICPICKTKFASQNKDACPKCQMQIEEMVKPTLLHYIYYHCTKRKKQKCFQESITVDVLEKQVDAILSNIQISERFKDWAIKYINELNDNEAEERNAILSSLQETYKDCVQRIDNLLKFKISPQNSDGSLLSDEEFKSQKEALLAEKKRLSEQLGVTDERIDNWVKRAEKAFNFACYARHWFMNGDDSTRKEILIGIGSNLVINNKTVLVDLEKTLHYLKDAKNEVPEISPMFEPEKEGYTTAQLEAFYSQNPSLLPRQDSNLQPSS